MKLSIWNVIILNASLCYCRLLTQVEERGGVLSTECLPRSLALRRERRGKKDSTVVSSCSQTGMARQPAKSLLPDSDSHPSFRYSLVWIDAKVDEDHNKRTLKGLRKIDPDTQSFSNKRQLTEYIDTQEKNRENSSIIVIVSGQFAEQIISSLHDSPCIAIFFIHCWNKKHVEHLNFPKLRTIHTEPGDLIDDIQHCNEILKTNVDFSLFSDQSSGDAGNPSKRKNDPYLLFSSRGKYNR